jgi:hypothetical protein
MRLPSRKMDVVHLNNTRMMPSKTAVVTEEDNSRVSIRPTTGTMTMMTMAVSFGRTAKACRARILALE